MEPSTNWKEVIAPTEEALLKDLSDRIGAAQTKLNERYGAGRAFHRRPVLGLRATFEVLPNLPAHATQGLFATPGTHEALLRLSNGSLHIQKDGEPDVRGLAIKVLGVDGPGALGSPTTSQDFLLINHETFAFSDAKPFIEIALAAARGPLALLGHLIKTNGFFGGLKLAGSLLASFKAPFSGFLSESFFSVLPIQCGPYAVRVRIVPKLAALQPKPASFADDVRAQLAKSAATFDVQLQFFVDDKQTPIEDAAVNWTEAVSPFVTVARLTIPAQPTDGDAHDKLAEQIETAKFDPWNALVAHKPLGQVMRARKSAYFISQKNRGVA